MNESLFSNRKFPEDPFEDSSRTNDQVEKKSNKAKGLLTDRICTDEEWLRLLTLIVLSPTNPIKVIRVEKRLGGSPVTKK